MKILPINTHKSFNYAGTGVSMSGRLPSKKVVANQVLSFLKNNSLQLSGNVSINPLHANKYKYHDVVVSYSGVKRVFDLKDKDYTMPLSLNGKSVQDVAYKFAKIASGKELFDQIEYINMCQCTNPTRISEFKPVIKVPDFFSK